MRSIALNFRSGAIAVLDVPTPAVRPRSILVANQHSLVSGGTEGYVIAMARKGFLGKALDRPDLAVQVINKAFTEGFWSTAQVVRNLIAAPLPLGYSSAGTVIETGPEADLFRPGDRVACAGLGQANHAEHVVVPVTMACRLPDSVSTEEGCFGTLGAIALHGVRLGQPQLDETFVVIGLGLLGQLCVQILKAHGCRAIGFDIDASKVQLALENGMDAGGVLGRDDPRERTLAHSGGYGADGVLIAAHTKSRDPIVLAADLCRERGRVVAVGLVNLNIPRRKFFEKELQLHISRAYGAGAYDSEYERKGRDYPLGYVRWTEGRNLAAFINLLARGAVNVRPLISHRFPLEQASDAYAIALGERQERPVAMLFTYGGGNMEPAATLRLQSAPSTLSRADPLSVGVIGAGKFAQGILLPALTRHSGVRILAVATAQGMTARHVAEKYGSRVCTTDYREVLDNPEIGTVLIATRHDTHAQITCDAIRAGKNIFLEKPLAISDGELDEIVAAHAEYGGTFMVGFNRRFSPLARRFAHLLAGRRQPLSMSFRFITPRILKGHESEWVHDPESGGQRIVGEMCHMVDTCSYFVGSPVRSVYARSIAGDAPAIPNYDTLHVTLTYRDGSIAVLMYVANSDATVPQERIELHYEGAYGLIDNFTRGSFSRAGRRTRVFGINQHKGWKEEVDEFVDHVIRKQPGPIPFESLVETTKVTFAIETSLRTGNVVTLAL